MKKHLQSMTDAWKAQHRPSVRTGQDWVPQPMSDEQRQAALDRFQVQRGKLNRGHAS
jgi:hypothetical protein